MNFKQWLENVEPWEMTRDEAMAERERLLRNHYELCQKHGGYPACSNVPEVINSRKTIEDWPDRDFHKDMVVRAIAQGKPVRKEVVDSIFWKKGELEKLYAYRNKAHPPKLGEIPDFSDMF